MSKQKIEWEKEKQLLLQKISHLEIRIEDYDGREKRLKTSQQGLIATLSKMNDDDNSKVTQAMIVNVISCRKI